MSLTVPSVPRGLQWTAAGLLAWLLLVILPLNGAAGTAEVNAKAASDQWNDATPLVQKLEDARSRPAPATPPPQALMLTVKDAINKAGIPQDDVHGLQDVGGTVKVEFTQVPGDLVVRFLFRLQSQGLTLQQWDMSSVSQPGVWSATGLVAAP